MADLNKDNVTTSATESINNNQNEGATMITKEDIAELKANLLGTDDTTAENIINDVKVEADAVIKQIAINDPIGAIKVRLLSNMTVNEMYASLTAKRYSYEQVEKFVQAVGKLFVTDKVAAEALVIDFYVSWISLFHLTNDECTGMNLTRDAIREFKAGVFAKVDSVLIPEWYKSATSKMVSAKYTTDLAADVVYLGVATIGNLGTRVPEAIVETAGKTILNTVKAVDKVVDQFSKRAAIKKLQQERDAIDKQIAEIESPVDTTPKF